jgi:AcrR family transcriptional regulator
MDIHLFSNIVFGTAAAKDGATAAVRYRTARAECSENEVPAMKTKAAATPKREDRRIQRTRQLLVDALLALVQERGFDDVTVQEVIDRANVGRATFYAHFDDKEDLLVQAMDPFSAHLRERQRQALRDGAGSDRDAFAFADELFAHAEGHRGVFRALLGRKGAAIVQRHFQRMQLDLVREEVKARAPAGAQAPEVEAVSHQIASGLFGMLVWWMEGRSRMTGAEASDLFRRTARGSLRSVFGP